MSKSSASTREARTPTARDLAIRQFAAAHLQGENQDLYSDMLVTLCRLARDNASRGDVKLLHKALAELRYGLKVFAPYRDFRKVSIFGSSRTPVDHPDYQAAEEFARQMCASGWMVITGAGGGIMRAGHGGAGAQASFGVAIRLPFEQQTNEIIADDPKLVNYRYFFTRKVTFLRQSHSVALFPGGFGTQDEGFEVLTLVQTGKAPLIPIVMCEQTGGTYWPHWRTYIERELLATGMISPQDTSLFRITDSVTDAVSDIQGFYRVFNSMRYVSDELVLRLNWPISDETLERLNDQFAGQILSQGRIIASSPLPQERDELPNLPRLRLFFDKRNYGLLRRLIDEINREPAASSVTV